MLTSGAAATAFSIVPRHVLGGAGFVPPSEKLTLAIIGCGTQALRELPDLLGLPEIQFVAVCDPNKDSQDYVDWSRDGLRSSLANAMGRPDWRRDRPGIPGGRGVAKEVIETVYARQRGKEQFKGCTTYVDFRELLEREKDVNAVWIMTPDHLHATIAIAAMKKGKHVRLHKPLANRLRESRLVIETARQTTVATHFQPASDGESLRPIKAWIDQGAIGTLREIHNWSNRPFRRTSTGHSGSGRRWLGRIIRTTRTPCFVAGMNSAAVRWRTWAITASGRSSNTSSSVRRIAWSPHPATSARSTATSPPRSRMITRSRPPASSGSVLPPKATGPRWTSIGTTVR